jgi:hypothetical protein
VVLVVLVAAAIGGDDKPGKAIDATVASSTTVPAAGTNSTAPATGSSSTTSATRAATTTTVPAGDGLPSAPWRGPTLARSEVPRPFLEAWERAENRSTCGLLVPSDTGPAMEGATASFSPVAGDAGWDIFLRKGAGVLEILGLFDRSARPEEERPAAFSRRWADGSVARYSPDDPGGEGADPEATAFEAVLTLPDQGCVYRIYDTLGKSHLEFILERLRFVQGTK